MKKGIYIFFSIVFLIYLLLPGPGKVGDFNDLPNSVKSDLPGDTYQMPNISGYFSDNYREFTTSYFKSNFQQKTIFPFPPIRLNYPPEYAFSLIKDQTQSTYLEEYVYPLRDSLFVNGMESFYEDGRSKFWGSVKLEYKDNAYYTKATIRYYPSPIWARVLLWVGINMAVIWIWKLGRKIIRYD